ncbi:MAG: hypothetical protein AB1726_02765 [Planctomycetota bacterium]
MKHSSRQSILWRGLVASALSAALLAACHNGGGGGGGGGGFVATVFEDEPNDTAADAGAVELDQVGSGDVDTAGDVDFWSILLGAGQAIEIELYAVRTDQAAWDTAINVPRLTVYDTDGVTKMLEQDYGAYFSDGWSWGSQDIDIALFQAPVAGTYFVAVTQDDQTLAGGAYGLLMSEVDLGALQEEIEAPGVSGDNDTALTAEPITPGILHGWHVDEEMDFYSFDIAGPSIVRFTLTAYRNGVYAGDDEYYDPEINLYDTDGLTVLDNGDDSYYYDSAIHYRIDTPGTYFMDVDECCEAGDAAYFLNFELIDASTAVAEVEPNDDTTTATAIAYGDLVDGDMGVGEHDWFSFTGTAGDLVWLQLFDSSNYVEADVPVDCDLLAPDGLTEVGYGGEGQFQVKSTILQESGTFYVHVEDVSGAPTSYSFALILVGSSGYETEANDDIASADGLDADERAAGVLDPAGDADYFEFTATENEPVTIAIYAGASNGSDGFFEYSDYGSSLNEPVLTIYDASATPLAASNGDFDLNAFAEGVVDGQPTMAVSFIAPASGTYYVAVEEVSSSGGSDYYYVIQRK